VLKKGSLERARRVRTLVAVATVGVLTASGIGLGAASADAVSPTTTTVVYTAGLGAESPTTGYPSTPWFYGYKGGANDPTASAVGTDGSFVLSDGTQLLHQFPNLATAAPTAGALDAFIAAGGGWVTTGTGNTSFQLPIFYGDKSGAPFFTTLYSSDFPAGTHTISTADTWNSTRTIGTTTKTVETNTLAALVAEIDAAGSGQELLASGVEASPGSTPGVASIATGSNKYTFATDVKLPTATKASHVQLSSIGLEGTATGTNSWFFGQNADTTTPHATVVGPNLVLTSTPTEGTQLLHQFTASTRPASLQSFIESGLSFTIAAAPAAQGTASFQVPLVYGASHFTTLRSADVGAGVHHISYGDLWQSSHAIGVQTTPATTGSVAANTDVPLGTLLADIQAQGGTQVIEGFGAQATQATTPAITSFQAGATVYNFINTKAMSFNSVAITGKAQFGNSLTAVTDLNGPSTAKLTYQWLANGRTIAKATASVYKIASAEVGKKLSVRVTATATGFTTTTATSSSVSIAAAVFAASIPTITGSIAPVVGQKLTAVWSGILKPTHFVYRWYRNGKAISGATKSTRTLTANDLATRIRVRIIGTRAGFTMSNLLSASSAPVGLGHLLLSGVTLTGSAKVGHTLTVRVAHKSAGVITEYAWEAIGSYGPVFLKFSTSPRFTIPAYLAGARIEGLALISKPGYVAVQIDTAPSAVVVK
jgi:hypothetical protein